MDSRFGTNHFYNCETLTLKQNYRRGTLEPFAHTHRLTSLCEYAVLIEKVYAVGPQPLERSFNDQLDMIWFAVKPGKPTSRLLIDIPTELGSD